MTHEESKSKGSCKTYQRKESRNISIRKPGFLVLPEWVFFPSDKDNLQARTSSSGSQSADIIGPLISLKLRTWDKHQSVQGTDHSHQDRNTQSSDFSITTVGSACVFFPDRVHHRCNPYCAHSCRWRNSIPERLDHRSQTMDHRNAISFGRLLSRVFTGQNSWSVLAQVWCLDKSDWEFPSAMAAVVICQGCYGEVPQTEWLIQQKFIILRFWSLEVQKSTCQQDDSFCGM